MPPNKTNAVASLKTISGITPHPINTVAKNLFFKVLHLFIIILSFNKLSISSIKGPADFAYLHFLSIEDGLPALSWQRFHLKRPHQLPNCDGRIKAHLRFACSFVEIFLKFWMHIYIIGEPRIEVAPPGYFRVNIMPLLNHSQTSVSHFIQRTEPINRMTTFIDLAVH